MKDCWFEGHSDLHAPRWPKRASAAQQHRVQYPFLFGGFGGHAVTAAFAISEPSLHVLAEVRQPAQKQAGRPRILLKTRARP